MILVLDIYYHNIKFVCSHKISFVNPVFSVEPSRGHKTFMMSMTWQQLLHFWLMNAMNTGDMDSVGLCYLGWRSRHCTWKNSTSLCKSFNADESTKDHPCNLSRAQPLFVVLWESTSDKRPGKYWRMNFDFLWMELTIVILSSNELLSSWVLRLVISTMVNQKYPKRHWPCLESLAFIIYVSKCPGNDLWQQQQLAMRKQKNPRIWPSLFGVPWLGSTALKNKRMPTERLLCCSLQISFHLCTNRDTQTHYTCYCQKGRSYLPAT